ncbi:MAG: hypothetical protein IKA47_10325 [Oscillospiraceae bacterium]|nr:hypothetical protein [Oscillospiraceae bacterium]
MKKLVVLLLATLVFLCGCEKEQMPEKKAPVSRYKSTGEYTDLGEHQLTWEALEALPKKKAGMTAQEARQTAVDFWRYCKSALWIPDVKYDIYKNENGVKVYKRSVEAGQVYGGLPYVSNATGNIYRLLDFMDKETGVVDVTNAGRYPLTFGGMCSSGCYWAWARVMNSADYQWTHTIVSSRGFIPVGPYTYDETIRRFSNEYGTHHVMEENGEQIMYQSYAQLQIGDGLGYSRENGVGHIIMCTIAPHVEYLEDGTIDGENSYIHLTDQGAKWTEGVTADGLKYQYESSVDNKRTFAKLYSACFIPYTFADLTGEEPIEETEVSFSYSGDTITEDQLFTAKVTSNYFISDIYVYVYDRAGNEVYKHNARAYVPSTKELEVHRLIDKSFTWGDWEDLKAGGDYTVKVEVMLGTGERPTLWEGKLIV